MTESENARQAIEYWKQERERIIDPVNDLKVRNFLAHGDLIDKLNASYADEFNIACAIEAATEAAVDVELLAAEQSRWQYN